MKKKKKKKGSVTQKVHLITCFKIFKNLFITLWDPSHHTQPFVVFIFSSATLIVNCDKLDKLFPNSLKIDERGLLLESH